MKKMREEISKMNNLRKRNDNREVDEEDFEDLELKEMSRREKASKTKRNQPVKAEDVNNYLLQEDGSSWGGRRGSLPLLRGGGGS